MKRNRKKIFGKLLCTGLLAAGLCFCAGCRRTMKFTSVNTAMGTMIYQTVYTSGEDVTDEITGRIKALEQDTLSWRLAGSEIAGINEQAGCAAGILLSDRLRQELTVLLEVSKRSGGSFDITLHPLVQLWNIDAWIAPENRLPEVPAQIRIPAPEQIEEALHHTGYKAVNMENSTLFLPADMSLDLGAAGKGIACDEIAAFLKDKEVSGAVISVGGSVLTYGSKPDGTPWQVAVINPADTTAYLGTLVLDGAWFVSTSGDYERFIEVDGVRYHHILDPATGYPAASGVRSVTIVCHSGILSDALSTACFVLGVEQGMELAESYGADALFVDEEGRMFMTEGMRNIFKESGEK